MSIKAPSGIKFLIMNLASFIALRIGSSNPLKIISFAVWVTNIFSFSVLRKRSTNKWRDLGTLTLLQNWDLILVKFNLAPNYTVVIYLVFVLVDFASNFDLIKNISERPFNMESPDGFQIFGILKIWNVIICSFILWF